LLQAAVGENEAAGIRKKPAPDALYAVMKNLSANPKTTVYVGDSDVDIQTAKNAGVDCICVTWGFRDRKFLEEKVSCKITTCKQTHSDNIAILEENKYFYDDTDAIITKKENSLLLLNFADCVPIILYSTKDNVGAIVHAGWRGTASEIAKKTAIKMDIEPENIVALIGPAIGKCCFNTDEDVFNKLIKNEDSNNYIKKENKYFIDLKQINREQLAEIGIENIDICNYCTCCMSDIFFSYRKENGITARHSAVVKIKRG
jgi:YfiH family protein